MSAQESEDSAIQAAQSAMDRLLGGANASGSPQLLSAGALGQRMDRPGLSELTAAQLFERAAEFATLAGAPDTQDYLRMPFHRLAIRYAARAARREIEEGRPARH